MIFKGKMARREIRDHIFKVLFMYEFLQNDIEETLLEYFANFPYEDETDENPYIGKPIEKDEPENVSDEAATIELSMEDHIRDIKNKVRDFVLKECYIKSIISENLDKKWDMSRVGKAELTIIKLAIYEIYYDKNIDTAVAINEAVELAKVYCDDKADKFVNGVLSTIVKNKIPE